MLALTELHNKQRKISEGDLWITSEVAETNAKGGSKDKAAGVAILLSKRMQGKIDRSGCVGSRIAWVRLKGPICPIFFVAVYIPHKYRTAKPRARDTIAQLTGLLQIVPQGDCIVVCGDLNCQLKRNVPGRTGQWSMTKRHEEKGHDQVILEMMTQADLFAVDTIFKPEAKYWGNGKRKRLCNATYLAKHTDRRPRKLDYFLVSNRWRSSVTNSKVRWGPALHRFGEKYDHGLLSITWAWRLRKQSTTPRPDFSSMSPEAWTKFDTTLHEKLIQICDKPVEVTKTSMGAHYNNVTECIRQTIAETVPPKKRQNYNGRVVSERTKKLYDERIRDFSSGRKITKADRQAWNKVLSASSKKDYDEWIERWIKTIETADEMGDTKEVSRGAQALAGKSRIHQQTQPSMNSQGGIINSEEELGELWHQFLEGKFSATVLEQARAEYPDIGRPDVEQNGLTYEEFKEAAHRMKSNKSPGPDGIPAEVWQHSALSHSELYFFLREVWQKECVPRSLVLCMFVMMHKKGSREDCKNYRAIGLLNHAFKILSVCILQRLMQETEWFLSDWQAGFRSQRGCRDNVLLLRVIYDNIIKGKKQCAVTFIDFEAAFDSVSHKFLDSALGKAGAKRKTRALFRAIYEAAQGAVRLKGKDGKFTMSQAFNVARGVIQGDIVSPIFFILALDELVQTFDRSGQGLSVGKIKALRVLGYADDAVMLAETVDEMTSRLTNFANAALKEADMRVKLSKTHTQIVQQRQKVPTATAAEVKAKERKYKYACEFVQAGCTARFKTLKGMRCHRSSCRFGYSQITEEKYEIDEIIDVFGKIERRLFLVKWKHHPGEDSWESGHLLMQDGCMDSIKEFWVKSG